MPFRRISAALFMSIFALQLSLGGVGAPCGMGDHASPNTDAMGPSVPGGMHMATVTSDAAASPNADRPASDMPPCEHPAAPEQCTTMLPCSPGFIAPAADAAGPLPHAHMRVAAAPVPRPLSASREPEPPPPRV